MRFHQDDEQGIQGVGTKEWAGNTAPFFVCKKAKDPRKAGLLVSASRALAFQMLQLVFYAIPLFSIR